MQFSFNVKGKTPILPKFWAQAPLGVKTPLGPLTKILDPRLIPSCWKRKQMQISRLRTHIWVNDPLSFQNTRTRNSMRPTSESVNRTILPSRFLLLGCVDTREKTYHSLFYGYDAINWSTFSTLYVHVQSESMFCFWTPSIVYEQGHPE